jgi:Protein of unknown function (DUF4064)
MSRTTEMVLGLLGGIFGFFAAFAGLFFGAVDEAVSGSQEISNLSAGAFVFSILAIIGAVLVKFKAKLGGWMMIVAGVGGIVSVSLFYVLPGLLLLIGGSLGAFRKDKSKQQAAA